MCVSDAAETLRPKSVCVHSDNSLQIKVQGATVLSDEWFPLSEADINISVERLTQDQIIVLKLKFEQECALRFLQIKPCSTNCPKFAYFYFNQIPVSSLQGVRLRAGIRNTL